MRTLRVRSLSRCLGQLHLAHGVRFRGQFPGQTRSLWSLTDAVRRTSMKITRNGIETTAGPSEWFTGAVFVDTVAAPSDGSHLSASSVHFTPRARTAWHTHPKGQTIWVTERVGLCQCRRHP